MAKKILPPAELTRLHYLTDEEADFILYFRLMDTQAKRATEHIAKAYAERYVDPTAGNVVSITRPA